MGMVEVEFEVVVALEAIALLARLPARLRG